MCVMEDVVYGYVVFVENIIFKNIMQSFKNILLSIDNVLGNILSTCDTIKNKTKLSALLEVLL